MPVDISGSTQQVIPVRWKAEWIWGPGEPTLPNSYMYFRKDFRLESSPKKVVCHVTGDTQYKLWINGRMIGQGPILCDPRWQSYDTHEVSSAIQPGENVIGIIVFHWGNGIEAKHSPFLHTSRGGLLCQLEIEDERGNKEYVGTDPSWRSRGADAWQQNSTVMVKGGVVRVRVPVFMDDFNYAEFYDARKEPVGWLDPGFDCSSWEPAIAVRSERTLAGLKDATYRIAGPTHPWVQLEPRDLPFMKDEALKPKEVVNVGEVLERASPNAGDVALRMAVEDVRASKATAVEGVESLEAGSIR